MMLGWCLIYLGIILLLGAALTSLLLQRQTRSIPELIGLCLILGAGSCGMLLIWLSMLGLRPSRATLLILGFIALCILIGLLISRRLPARTGQGSAERGSHIGGFEARTEARIRAKTQARAAPPSEASTKV